jgi:hypothetical protein
MRYLCHVLAVCRGGRSEETLWMLLQIWNSQTDRINQHDENDRVAPRMSVLNALYKQGYLEEDAW